MVVSSVSRAHAEIACAVAVSSQAMSAIVWARRKRVGAVARDHAITAQSLPWRTSRAPAHPSAHPADEGRRSTQRTVTTDSVDLDVAPSLAVGGRSLTRPGFAAHEASEFGERRAERAASGTLAAGVAGVAGIGVLFDDPSATVGVRPWHRQRLSA